MRLSAVNIAASRGSCYELFERLLMFWWDSPEIWDFSKIVKHTAVQRFKLLNIVEHWHKENVVKWAKKKGKHAVSSFSISFRPFHTIFSSFEFCIRLLLICALASVAARRDLETFLCCSVLVVSSSCRVWSVEIWNRLFFLLQTVLSSNESQILL